MHVGDDKVKQDNYATIEEALAAARDADGNTVLVLVSPVQAHRLWLAMQIADMVAGNDPEDINAFGAAVSVYKKLAES